MAKQKRNTHSPEFKAKVALEAVRGVHVNQWNKALLAESASVFEKKRGPKPKAEFERAPLYLLFRATLEQKGPF